MRNIFEHFSKLIGSPKMKNLCRDLLGASPLLKILINKLLRSGLLSL